MAPVRFRAQETGGTWGAGLAAWPHRVSAKYRARLIIALYALVLLVLSGGLDAIAESSGPTVSEPMPPLLLGLGIGTLWYTWRRHLRLRRGRAAASKP